MTDTEHDVPRIYVASLSDYNGGILHGVWISLDEDLDDVWAAIHEMLKASPEFKRFPLGGPAEEFAIHDHEYFGDYRVSEYEGIEQVHKIAQAIIEHGEAFAVWLADCDGDVDNVELFEDQFRGEFESDKAYAEHFCEEVGWGGLEPKQLEGIWSYLDFEHIAREMSMGGTSFCERHDPWRVYVFETY